MSCATGARDCKYQVVIPVYNGGSQLLDCLRSLAELKDPQPKVLLIDNASTDGAVNDAPSIYSEVEIYPHSENRGFAAACNTGLKICKSRGCELALILNQDTIVAPDTAEILVASILAKPQAAVVGPKTYFLEPASDGRPRLLFAGAFHRRLPLRFILPGSGQPDDGCFDTPRQVDVIWGHGMLLRLAALDDVGLFDPAFFLYHEDVELCFRLRQNGYEIWYEPAAVMWHDLSDSDRAEESEAWRWNYKVESTWHFHRKHYNWAKAFFFSTFTGIHEAVHLGLHGHHNAVIHLILAELRLLLKTTRLRDQSLQR